MGARSESLAGLAEHKACGMCHKLHTIPLYNRLGIGPQLKGESTRAAEDNSPHRLPHPQATSSPSEWITIAAVGHPQLWRQSHPLLMRPTCREVMRLLFLALRIKAQLRHNPGANLNRHAAGRVTVLIQQPAQRKLDSQTIQEDRSQ